MSPHPHIRRRTFLSGIAGTVGLSLVFAGQTRAQSTSDPRNKLVVIIDRQSRGIWGMQLTANPVTRRYFGGPDGDMKALLEAALKGSLANVGARGPATVTPPDASAARNGPTHDDSDEAVLTAQPGAATSR